jgi:hypothetical protein
MIATYIAGSAIMALIAIKSEPEDIRQQWRITPLKSLTFICLIAALWPLTFPVWLLLPSSKVSFIEEP